MTTDNKQMTNLFGTIDLSDNDFLDRSEANGFGDLFSAPAGDDLFGSAPAPVVPAPAPTKEEAKEEIPVVQIKVPGVEVKQTKTSSAKTTAKKETKKTDPALSKNIKEQMKKKEERKVDGTWEVAYAAQRLNPPHEMTLEELRQYLELDWPELSKERCRMTIDEEKKLIVPIVSGAKNG